MKVGKVIKIKVAEVNRLLFLIVILWLPVLLLSCSDEKDEQRIDEEQKEGIRVDFGRSHRIMLLCLFLLWAIEWWH